MPPRKSDASKPGTGDEATPSKERDSGVGSGGLGVEDLSLPRTMVQRLAKGVLPPNTQIHKDAVLAMSKSATVFVSYLSAQANENAHKALKKTISPDHVLEALSELEFDNFLPRLKLELAKYNEVQTEKRNSYRKKTSSSQVASGGALDSHPDGAHEALETPIGDSTPGDHDVITKSKNGDDVPPAAKKVRISDANGIDSSRALSEEEEEDDDDTLEDDTGAGLEPEADAESDVGDAIEDEEDDQDDADQIDRLEDPDEDGNKISKQDEALHEGSDSD